jgi:hypothetical protein
LGEERVDEWIWASFVFSRCENILAPRSIFIFFIYITWSYPKVIKLMDHGLLLKSPPRRIQKDVVLLVSMVLYWSLVLSDRLYNDKGRTFT